MYTSVETEDTVGVHSTLSQPYILSRFWRSVLSLLLFVGGVLLGYETLHNSYTSQHFSKVRIFRAYEGDDVGLGVLQLGVFPKTAKFNRETIIRESVVKNPTPYLGNKEFGASIQYELDPPIPATSMLLIHLFGNQISSVDTIIPLLDTYPMISHLTYDNTRLFEGLRFAECNTLVRFIAINGDQLTITVDSTLHGMPLIYKLQDPKTQFQAPISLHQNMTTGIGTRSCPQV